MSVSAALSTSALDVGPRVALHILNRLGYGPRPGDIQRVLDRGVERYVEDQFEPGPDPELDTRLRGFGSLGYSISQILTLYNADNNAIRPIQNDLFAAKIVRAAHSANQLREVLVDFWFNHFNVYYPDGFAQFSTMAYERDAIRPHVLGRFRDLLGAVAAHPAMLFYLDNYLSRASRTVNGRLVQGLNENYGRELLELHTVSVDAGYTQEHVFDAARCFTGWGIDSVRNGGNFVYNSQFHDTGSKSVFGLDLPAGGQKDDGDRLLDYLASHPSTAEFISRKLAQRFVSDDPSPRLVSRMAARFRASDGDIKEVLRTMVSSTDFWAEAFGQGKPKTPFEFVISALRAANANVVQTGAITTALNAMGMPSYLCVPPTGYSNRGVDWLNPSSQLNRMNFALDLAAGAVGGAQVDARRVVRDAGGNPEETRSSVAAISNAIFARSLSQQTVDAAGRISAGGPVSVAARVLGSLLGGPEMQVR
jgi:uncharacterized protein (DUF1800 family)